MRTCLKALIILAFATSITGCAAAEEVEDDDAEISSSADAITASSDGETLTTTGNVNLRSGAGSTYAVLRVLPSGTKVTSEGAARGGFLNVTAGTSTGWIHGNYLARSGGSGTTTGGGGGGTGATPWDGKHADASRWSQYTADAIAQYGSAMRTKRPSDVASFCPNYANLDEKGRTQFWVGLVAAIARYESNYNPNTRYQENFKDSSGTAVVSRGLLQLSAESARNYGCSVSSGAALHDAKVNLTCGVRIINHWLAQDGVISAQTSDWRGAARYWAVLRKSSTLGPIRAMTRGLSVCK
jgi:uncharacterized protein YraI